MVGMLEILADVLSGKKNTALILADWIEDNKLDHPEAKTYLKRLRQPMSLRLQTILDVIIKFGPKKERSLVAKWIRGAIRSRKRPHGKLTIRAYTKKRWSLTRPWYILDVLKKRLGVKD